MKKILLTLLLLGLLTVNAGAQTVGPAFSFSDVSLQKSDLMVYQLANGSMVYLYTINSTSSFIYDPTSDYVVVFKPSLVSTYGSSPEGLLNLITDNPELAALVLIVFFVLFIIGLFAFIYRRH
jgi:hypothetical protein